MEATLRAAKLRSKLEYLDSEVELIERQSHAVDEDLRASIGAAIARYQVARTHLDELIDRAMDDTHPPLRASSLQSVWRAVLRSFAEAERLSHNLLTARTSTIRRVNVSTARSSRSRWQSIAG